MEAQGHCIRLIRKTPGQARYESCKCPRGKEWRRESHKAMLFEISHRAGKGTLEEDLGSPKFQGKHT